MSERSQKIKTLAIVTVAGLAIVAGLLVGAVRLLDLVAPKYRQQIAAQVSQRINHPLQVGALDLGWDWYGPVIKLKQAELLNVPGGTPVIRANRLALHFGFWDLVRGQLQPQGISVSGPELSAYRDAQGRLRIRGLPASNKKLDWPALIQKLDRLDFIRISGGQLTWTPAPDKAKTLSLSNITGALTHHEDRHQLNAQVKLPAAVGEELSINASLMGDAGDSHNVQAHAQLSGSNLDLVAVAKAAGLNTAAASAGRNDLDIWSDWRAGEFSRARATLTGRAARTQAPRLLQTGAAMDFSITPWQTGYRINLDAVRDDNRYVDRSSGVIQVEPERKYASAKLYNLPASLLGVGLSSADASGAWRTAGRLKQINLEYDGSQQPAVFNAYSKFEQLRASNTASGLDINGLNGELHLSRNSGSLNLRGASGTLTWPGYLNGHLPLDKLEGDIGWEKTKPGWQIHAIDVRWLGAGTVVTGGGNIELPHNGLPTVDLSGQFQAGALPRVLSYIPQAPDLPNPRLRDWLSTAVKAGKIASGQLRLRGPLDAFPFANGGGMFKLHANIEGATLKYKPEWPELTNGRGQFTLQGDTLTVDAQSGQMLGVAIGPASARIDDVREPILKLDGQVTQAKASNLLNFLPHSPLKEKFGKLAQALELAGPADLALQLSVPLKHELGEVSVDGQISLNQVTLNHRVLPAAIKNIRGKVNFNLKGLSGQDIHGQLLGLPLIVDLSPAPGGALDIDASSLVRLPRDTEALQRFVPVPVLKRIQGEGVWHALLQVEPSGKASDLALRSDLNGFALNLPAPLAKPADTPLSTRIEVNSQRERIHIDVSDRLDIIINSLNGNVYRMDMDFGDTGKPAPAGRGIWLGGHIAKLDLLPWQRLLAEFIQDGKNDDSPSLSLRGADLNIDQTLLSGQHLEQVHFILSPLTASQGWLASFSGVGANGQVKWLPAPANTPGARALVSGHFEEVVLEPNEHSPAAPATAEKQDKPPINPGQLPVTNVSIDKVMLNGHDFGRFTLAASAIAGGLRLDQFNLSDGRLKMDATGKWWQESNQTQAQLEAKIKGKGFDVLFRTFGYAPSVRADQTDIQANLSIAPNPHGLAPAALNGDLNIKFDDGALLTVDPGAGRILGLFNFYALPRRLLLNFSDVVEKGLGFDKIRAKFNIQSGIAHTDDLRVKTPSSTIHTEGQVDLVQHTYDQHVTIVPKLSSGVAVAGTLLGGPVVGAVLLAAQKLLEKPISKLSSISYHLIGDWKDPQIETITAADEQSDKDTPGKNEQKTTPPEPKP